MEHSRNIPLFYLTAPSPCAYLPNRVERKVFTELVGKGAPALYDELTKGGFRRSQSIAYRPACEKCKACISLRIRVNDFILSKTQKRILERNSDLYGEVKPPKPTSEQYSLFQDYIQSRHYDGEMLNMSLLDYSLMVEESYARTRLIEYKLRGPDSEILKRGQGEMLACSLTDVMADGLSMVYSFYAGAENARSLGSFMILDHIQRAKDLGLQYLYLGFWVRNSPKMAYKAKFLPHELLIGSVWQTIQSAE